MWRSATPDGEAELFLDPNTFSQDGTVALVEASFTDDGRYFGYSVSKAGSDWVEIFVIDTETKELLPDVIKWVKFSGAVWAADGRGFYYAAYDAPEAGRELSGMNEFQTVYYHKLGEAQADDKLIYRDNAHPLRYFHGRESDDGKYIFVTGIEGTHGSEVLYRETTSAAPFRVLLSGFENDFTLVGCEGD
jgi:prolyl oligopeptidase